MYTFLIRYNVHRTRKKQYYNKKHIEYTFHAKLKYIDDRIELTEKHTQTIIDKFIKKNYTNLHKYECYHLLYIPPEIKQLIMEYLGYSFIFWYGPFTKETQISQQFYKEIDIGSIVRVQYDPKYPKNCFIYEQVARRFALCCSAWSGGFGISLAGSVYLIVLFIDTIQALAPKVEGDDSQIDMERACISEIVSLLLVIVFIMVGITIGFIMYIKKIYCCKMYQSELRCTEVIEFEREYKIGKESIMDDV